MPIVSYGRHARLPPVWASLLCLAAAGTPADLAAASSATSHRRRQSRHGQRRRCADGGTDGAAVQQ